MADVILAQSGIYAIRNKINGKFYIGSSGNVRRRRTDHLRALKVGKHKNTRLTAAWKKYGAEAFEFFVLEYVAADNLIEREQFWISAFRSDGAHGYNILPCAGSRAGSKATPETLEKLRKASTGRTHSDETKQRLSAVLTGKVRTEEMKARVKAAAVRSTANKTPEQRSLAAKKGAATRAAKLAAMTPDERAAYDAKVKASVAKGNETKKAIGYVVSQETKDKQMAIRIKRGAEERRAIGLRAWKTKRLKQAERLNAKS